MSEAHDLIVDYFKSQDPEAWAEAQARVSSFSTWRCLGCGLTITTDEQAPSCDNCDNCGGEVVALERQEL